eukprot:scaffold5222_cov106-Isochrysis_galbana.AAC.4
MRPHRDIGRLEVIPARRRGGAQCQAGVGVGVGRAQGPGVQIGFGLQNVGHDWWHHHLHYVPL